MEPQNETQTENTVPANWILGALSFIFKFLCALTISQVYNFVFALLSLASLVLILIINFPKAKAVWQGKTKEDI